MKKMLLLILTVLFMIFAVAPNSFAQDYTQMNLPEGAKARFGKGWISGDIAYSLDGTRLAVASSIGIWIYDANTYAEITLLTGHTGPVNSVAFSPDSKKLVSGAHDKTVRLWDARTGSLLRTFDVKADVYDVAFSPDGKMFGSMVGRTIWLWDAETGQLLRTRNDPAASGHWWGSVGTVNCLAFSSDSKEVAAGYYYKIIRFFDVSTGNYLRTSSLGGGGGVNDLAFSSDGVTLAAGGGNDIYLLGARTGAYWQTVGSHGGGVNSVVFSPDGKILASGGNNNKIYLWDAFTGEGLWSLEGHTNGVLGVSFSADSRTIASASWTEIRFWNANTGQLLHTIDGHTRSIYSVAFSPDSKTLASGYQDGTIQLLDVTTGKHEQTIMAHKGRVYSVVFSPDGKTLASGSQDRTVHLWDATKGLHINRLTGHTYDVYSVTFSPDGKILASGGADQTIYLWNIGTGEQQTIKTSGDVRSVSLSPDGQTLVSAAIGSSIPFRRDGGIRLRHLRTGRQLRTFVIGLVADRFGRLKSRPTLSAAFSPDGNIIAGGVDAEIWLWDTRSGEWLKRLTEHRDNYNIFSILFSPDGSILASGSADQTICLWDVSTGVLLNTLIGHTGEVRSVAFSPDGSILASGSTDGTVLLWDLIPSDPTSVTPSIPTTSNAVVSLSPSAVQSPAIGKQLIISLNIADGENVTDYQATVSFDPTALSYISSANGDYLPSGALFVPPVINENTVTLDATAPAGESNDEGTLAILTFKVVAAKASTVTLSDVLLTNNAGVSHRPQIESIQITEPPQLDEDVNGDGIVDIEDLVLVAANFGQTGKNKADVNGDGIVDLVDLTLVTEVIDDTAAAPSARGRALDFTPTRAEVQKWLHQALQINLTDPIFQRGILMLEQLLIALTPEETALLPNYPNPFNPETWIPYHLAKDADVTLHIYAVNGTLVRTLALGHQPVGMYQSRSRAAYWDGRNARGEPVASGVYFYTLKAGEFTATRKMLIRK